LTAEAQPPAPVARARFANVASLAKKGKKKKSGKANQPRVKLNNERQPKDQNLTIVLHLNRRSFMRDMYDRLF
jgi:hypothetical protein